MTQETKITLELTADEALVFFEWLARFNEKDEPARFEDAAEQRALWNIEALLEKSLVAPFKPNYAELLTAARDRLRDKD